MKKVLNKIKQINNNKKDNVMMKQNMFDDIKVQVIFCIILMIIIFSIYPFMKDYAEEIRALRRFNTEYYSTNEYVRTIDCAPIIDQYGVEQKYRIEFELKTEISGDVIVYFQNGSTSKYRISEVVNATAEFQKYILEVEPELYDVNEIEAYLSFYGEYGSGVIPTVRCIRFEVIEQE